MRQKLAAMAEALGTIIGLSNYRLYCEHMAKCHPDRPVLSASAFFAARQQARYGSGGRGRCC
ncbi:YbdD/YjiX family protein [Sphingomonas sp. ASY06-1R]|uniref:YbdD/YjiX family protein n=1 Tax=Sphingomonas sp. ASY06-1R TaxID=3445771 RepID=UPI003FA1C469